MEEKKTNNDTEINVGMLEDALIDTLKEVTIKFSKDSYICRILTDTIHLIHRLQSESQKQYEDNCLLEAENSVLRQAKDNLEIEVSDYQEKLHDLDCENAEIQEQVEFLKVSWNILCDFLGEEICKQGENEDIFTEILDKVNEILPYDTGLAKYKQQAVKDTAREFAKLVEFHSVSTRDDDGREIFTISVLGLKEILHEEFGIPYDEIAKEISGGTNDLH